VETLAVSREERGEGREVVQRREWAVPYKLPRNTMAFGVHMASGDPLEGLNVDV